MKKLVFVFGISFLFFGCDYEIVKKEEVEVLEKNGIEAIEKVKTLEVEKNEVSTKLIETEKKLEEVIKKNNKEEDLEEIKLFILNYSEAYCRMRSMENRFWEDYNSEKFTKAIERDGSDIPTMNFIGKMSLNRLKRSEVKSILSRCNNIYPERTNTLNFAFTHLNNFFKGSANLLNFEEFKKDVAPELGAFREAIGEAPGTLMTSFLGYEIDNPFLSGMEGICDIRLSLNQENEGDEKSDESQKEEVKKTDVVINNEVREFGGDDYLSLPPIPMDEKPILDKDVNESLKRVAEEKKDEIFKKNQECLKQKEEIKNELKLLSKNDWEMSLEEIFYSPVKNECFYIDRVRVQYIEGGTTERMRRLFKFGMNPLEDPFEDMSCMLFSPIEWTAILDNEYLGKDVYNMRKAEISKFEKRVNELKK